MKDIVTVSDDVRKVTTLIIKEIEISISDPHRFTKNRYNLNGNSFLISPYRLVTMKTMFTAIAMTARIRRTM